MKRIALLLAALGAVLFGAGAGAPASAYPFGVVSSLTALQTEGLPGFEVPAVVSNCFPGETVVFTLGDSTATTTCSSVSFQASANLQAPDQLGPATVAADLLGTEGAPDVDGPDESRIQRPKTLTAGITVVSQAPDGTTPDTSVAAVPISGDLPSTGSSGIGTTTMVALGLSIVGLGLLVVSQLRRRDRATA